AGHVDRLEAVALHEARIQGVGHAGRHDGAGAFQQLTKLRGGSLGFGGIRGQVRIYGDCAGVANVVFPAKAGSKVLNGLRVPAYAEVTTR
ncbi:MAG: hypothetical protein ACT4P4_09805, partial [Betaproteobacteria bacterium]